MTTLSSSVSAVLAAFEEERVPDSEPVKPPHPSDHICSCGSAMNMTEEGFWACVDRGCGRIDMWAIDRAPEWRFYSSADGGCDPTRCGLPVNPLLQESSYGCRVSSGYSASAEMRKVRRYTEWQAMPYREKARWDAFQRIRNHARRGGLPEIVIDAAMRYHTRISGYQTFRGLNRSGVLAASVYVACRIGRNPRTAKEIAEIFNLDTASATRGVKNAMSIINSLERELEDCEKSRFESTRPSDFVSRYCSRLGMSDRLGLLCRFVALKVEEGDLIPENTPHAVAAGLVYFVANVCGARVTKRDVSAVSDISEVTINKCYKKLVPLRTKVVPPLAVRSI
jgi:transcription initiation factor TFIIB